MRKPMGRVKRLKTACVIKKLERLNELKVQEGHMRFLHKSLFSKFVDLQEMKCYLITGDSLLRVWDDKENGFKLGDAIMPFIVDDIEKITGLPTQERRWVFTKVQMTNPFGIKHFQKIKPTTNSIWKKLNIANAGKDKSKEDMESLYILNFFATMLFPNSNNVIERKLCDYVDDLSKVGEWNWAEGVYDFLIKCINEASPKVRQMLANGNKKYGVNFFGAASILQVWLFEHRCKWASSKPKVNPLMVRWAGVTKVASENETNSKSYRSKFYVNIIEDLKPLQVLCDSII